MIAQDIVSSFGETQKLRQRTIGQLEESMLGIWCAKRGTHADGTIFGNHNIESVMAELEKIGYKNAGYQKLYSGFTGEYIDTLIYMGPTYYQRLMKFVNDTVYAISKGRTDELTRQPLVGKARHGSLRLGEMEVNIPRPQCIGNNVLVLSL